MGWGSFCKKKAVVTTTAPTSTTTVQKCHMTGQRCAGESGHPYVEWLGCCKPTDVCIRYEAFGWGSFCLPGSDYEPSNDNYTPKCYRTGQRCAGAPGREYIPWLGCCDMTESCVEDARMGWGSFCKGMMAYPATEAPRRTYYATMPTTDEKYHHHPDYEKCYSSGQRCAGAPGFEHVAQKPCCRMDERCTVDSTRGWGAFCMQWHDESRYSGGSAHAHGHQDPWRHQYHPTTSPPVHSYSHTTAGTAQPAPGATTNHAHNHHT